MGLKYNQANKKPKTPLGKKREKSIEKVRQTEIEIKMVKNIYLFGYIKKSIKYIFILNNFKKLYLFTITTINVNGQNLQVKR